VVTASAAETAFGVIELVIIVGWASLFAVGLGVTGYITVLRGRRLRQRQAVAAGLAGPAGPAGLADPLLSARLAELRAADPYFDPQLLLEAAQMVCLLMFAAMATGDEQPIRHLAAPSFWPTFFGRYIRTSARDARLQRRPVGGPGGYGDRSTARRYARLPVDYQASAPELIGLELGRQQRARVRVSFSQLRAIVSPRAQSHTAMASATSLPSLAASFGESVGSRANSSRPELSWLGWAGQYVLDFVRPADAQTDPSAAPASRTCAACGATYRSELAAECAHCHAERPVPWGQWRLSQITAVE
jgi:hypothetical protein